MLKQKLVLSYFSKIIIQLFQILVTIVVARIAGASVLGTIAFATSFVSMFYIFFDFGQGTAHLKLVSEGQNEKNCNAIYAKIQLSLSLLFFIITLGFFLFSKYILNQTFESEEHQQVILLTIFTISLSNLFSIPRTIFNAKVEQAKADIPDLIKQIVYQILRLTVVLLGFGALAIASSNLVSTLMVIPIYLYLMKGVKFGKWNNELFKKYVLISIPVFITNVVDIITSYIDKVLLQYFYNSEVVGIYVAGFSIGGFITLIGTSSGLLLLPTFSKDIKDENYNKVSISIRKFERFTFFFIFPFVLLSSIGSDTIIKLILGNKYLRAIPVLSIINFSAFITSYSMIYGVVLSSKGLFKYSAKLYIIKLIFFLLFSFVFIHPKLLALESKGMALAIFCSNALMGGLFVLSVKVKEKRIKIFPEKYLIFYCALFGIISYIFYSLTSTILYKIIYLLLLLFLFWIIGGVIKLFDKSDIDSLKKVFSLTLMYRYISGELSNKESNI